MKIKEIEELIGMSKDNIRFYEKVGLIKPLRNDNGYREYNENDVQTLKRIKLLRCLHVSVDDIKNIQDNEIELTNCLNKQLIQLENEKNQLESSMQVCKQMISDNVSYIDLNADSYLHIYNVFNQNNELKEDVLKTLNAPWKRYFARSIDYAFYGLFVSSFLTLCMDVNLLEESLSIELTTTIFTLLLMQFIEPLLLSKFKTTLGKWIFGIYVVDDNGNNLSYISACNRTTGVIMSGLGFYIPFYSLYKEFQSYKKCINNQLLPWETDNIQIIKDDKAYRYFLVVITYIIFITLSIGIARIPNMAPNRGDITISEFVENANFYSKDYRLTYLHKLNDEGKWVNYNDELIEDINYPNYNYVLEDGKIKEISFEVNLENVKGNVSDYQPQMMTAILGYLTAQDSYTPLSFTADSLIKDINSRPYQDFEYHKHGLIIQADYEYKNLKYKDYNLQITRTDNQFSLKFVIKQEK